jgi:hypothetical protein
VERVIHRQERDLLGVWFGTPAVEKAEPLDKKIVNKDTLEILTLARGRTPTTIRLRRVK